MSASLPQTKRYKQEGRTGMYQSMLWALSVDKARLGQERVLWGDFFVFFKKNQVHVLWDANGLERVATAVLGAAGGDLPPSWQERWQEVDTRLTAASRALLGRDMDTLSLEELQQVYDQLFELDQHMWSASIFIDAFDPGFDRLRMEEIAKQYQLEEEEVRILATPTTPAFITEWHLALENLQKESISKEELRERFFWYATNYVVFGELTGEFIETENRRRHEAAFLSPQKEQDAILLKRGLAHNPLQLFQTLTTWRDARKRLNYIGLYGLLKVLREVLERQSIDSSLVNALLPHQVPELFAQTLDLALLQSQFDEGVLLHMQGGGLSTFSLGNDAQAGWESLESAPSSEEVKELHGMIACRGKAVGRVRIIPDVNSASAALMKKGEILVTSMTRPEFLPLMHLAGAIVTNEGGVTSHAAIVSRELRKPCLIGTRTATDVLKNGDLVEVDAEKGVVRIVEKQA